MLNIKKQDPRTLIQLTTVNHQRWLQSNHNQDAWKSVSPNEAYVLQAGNDWWQPVEFGHAPVLSS